MVGREVDGPLCAVQGRSWALCWRSWAALGMYVCSLGPLLGPMLAVLERSWALCWRSWAGLGPMLAVLGRSWGLCWRSWDGLGPYVGGLVALPGPMLAVLGRSWGLSWRSWLLLGPMLAVLGRDQGEKRPKPGKVSQTRAGARSQSGRDVRGPRRPRSIRSGYLFFL